MHEISSERHPVAQSNTDSASSVSSGNDVLTFQPTLASDQIHAQIPTATAKVRSQLPRGPLTASLPLEL